MRRKTRAQRDFDYEGEKRFFSEPVVVLRDFNWVGTDVCHWIEGLPEALADKAVLEIGASEGLYAAYLYSHAKPRLYVASDLVPHRMLGLLNFAKNSPGLVVTAGNAYRLPFKDEAFDVVISNGVLVHLPNHPAVASEIHRVLRPAGVFYGREPNCHNPVVRVHVLNGPLAGPNMTPTYPEELREAFESAGFAVRVSCFWQRFPRISNKYLSVSVRITAIKG